MRTLFVGLVWTLALVALLLPTAAIAAQETPGAEVTPLAGEVSADGQSLVKIIHASPDAPAVDVYVDDTVAIEGVEFGAVSDTLTVPSGDRQIRVVPTGTDPEEGSVIDEEIGFDEGNTYEVAVVGLLSEIEAKVYDVDLGAIDEEGQARVRVVHAAPGSDDIDVAVAAGDNWFEGIGFGDASDHQDVEEGTYDLEIKTDTEDDDDDKEVVLAASDVAIEAGMVYDLFVIGQAADESLQVLPVGYPTAVPCSNLIEVGTADDSCVRVVHAVGDGPSVDVYVGDTAVAEGIAFGAATEYLNLPNGEQQIRVVAAGESTDDAMFDMTETFEAGQAYLIVASGSGEDIEGDRYELDLSPLAAESARVRVVHSSSDAGDVDVAVTGGDVLFEGVSYRDASDYATIPVGNYDLEVRSTESEDVATDVQGLQLESGFVYDIVAAGSAEGDTLELITLATNAVAGSTDDTGTPSAEATPLG